MSAPQAEQRCETQWHAGVQLLCLKRVPYIAPFAPVTVTGTKPGQTAVNVSTPFNPIATVAASQYLGQKAPGTPSATVAYCVGAVAAAAGAVPNLAAAVVFGIDIVVITTCSSAPPMAVAVSTLKVLPGATVICSTSVYSPRVSCNPCIAGKVSALQLGPFAPSVFRWNVQCQPERGVDAREE
jgi:hypothetical protein